MNLTFTTRRDTGHSATATPRTGAPATTRTGATVWLTGLSGAGKSTLAQRIACQVGELGRAVEVLDGDALRARLSPDLGFSRADRETNVARVGFVAELLARNGVLVLVPVIAPYSASRARVRAEHRAAGAPYVEIHVATPLDECIRRDVKGLYAAAQAGAITAMTGVDDPYEPPDDPDLRLDTTHQSVGRSAGRVVALLRDRGLL